MNVDNFNGNQPVSICIDTTGPDANKHDLVEIAVIPMTLLWERDRNYNIFNTVLKPIRSGGKFEKANLRHEAYYRPHLCRARRATYDGAVVRGIDPMGCADLFEDWYGKLNLKPTKRLMALTYDWPFVSTFLKKWLGYDAFDQMFDFRYRDLIPLVMMEDDHRVFNLRNILFPKHDLSYIGNKLGYEAVLQLPCAERAVAYADLIRSYHLKRNSWAS